MHILRRLYYEFTGQMLPADTVTNVPNSNMDYKSNLEKALFGELDAVAKYRKNGQVELILRAMELYGYNLKFIVNDSDITNEERSLKFCSLGSFLISLLKVAIFFRPFYNIIPLYTYNI